MGFDQGWKYRVPWLFRFLKLANFKFIIIQYQKFYKNTFEYIFLDLFKLTLNLST